MKAIAYALFAAFVGATLTSCEVLVNDDGSKSVIVDPDAISKALGQSGDGTLKFEDGKIVATK